MFYKAEKIVDIFIPAEQGSRTVGDKRVAFVRFASRREAEKAIDLAKGRSWCGRKIQLNMARYDLETEKRELGEKFRCCRHKESQVSKESNPNTVKTKDAVNRKVDWVGKLKPKVAGWITEEGSEKVVSGPLGD